MGQRRRIPADPLPGARRRVSWTPVQGLGTAFHGRQPVLVQRLYPLHGRSGRTECPNRRGLEQARALGKGGRRMGTGSVNSAATSAPPKPPSWRLAKPHDAQTQGIVVSGFSDLPWAQALFLVFQWPENEPDGPHVEGKGAWLKTLCSVARITDAIKPAVDPDSPFARAASVAFTWTGLQKIGLKPDALATFSAPFSEGMYQEDRLRRLGDRNDGVWQGTVIPGGPRWSGNIPPRKNMDEQKQAWERTLADIGHPKEDAELKSETPVTVHALLLLYAKDKTEVKTWANDVEGVLLQHDVRIA